MATPIRSARTSQAPGSRYETWPAGEVHANNVPDFYEVPPTEWRSNRSNYTQNTPRRSEVTFDSPTVSPSDSISKAPLRRDNGGREYATYSRRSTSASSRRPPMRARRSSDDGTSWSRSQPLTEDNLDAFNEAKSRRSRRSDYTAESSRRPSRRSSNPWKGGRVVEDRDFAQPSERSSRRRSIYYQDDYAAGSQARSRSVRDQQDYYATGSQARSKSVRDQADYYTTGSQARSRNVKDQPDYYATGSQARSRSARDQQNYYVAGSQRRSRSGRDESDYHATGSQAWSRSDRDQDYDVAGPQRRSKSVREESDYHVAPSRVRSRTVNSRPESSLATEVIAAAAAGGAILHNNAPPPSRAATYQDMPGQMNVTPRRASRAPSVDQSKAMTAYRPIPVEGFDTQIQPKPPSSSSSSSKPSPPRELAPPMGPTPPGEMEWERRVHIREYRRPRDGKLVQDRECIVRKICPPQAPGMTPAVPA